MTRPGIERAYDEGSAQRTQSQRSHPIEGPKETTPAGSLARLASFQEQIGNRAVSALVSDVRGQTASGSVETTPAGSLARLASLQRQIGNRALSALVSDPRASPAYDSTIQRQLDPVVSPTGSETSGSRYFGARHRTKINQQVATYNRSPAAGAECTAEEAQQGLKDLFSIQQQALRWMEGLGNRQDAKRVGIADWHQQQYMPEQDRLEQRFLAQSDLAATLPELTDRTGGLGGKAASARARDRRFNGAGWEVINSETFQVTAEEGLTVYRMVNTTSEAPELVPSYDPRGPRSIRSQEPTASDMMSYGHVYFAPNKKICDLYRTYLDQMRPIGLATYTLPQGFRFKRDPEIPGGFRATTAMPDPVSVRTA